jgi:hypothetical protein
MRKPDHLQSAPSGRPVQFTSSRILQEEAKACLDSRSESGNTFIQPVSQSVSLPGSQIVKSTKRSRHFSTFTISIYEISVQRHNFRSSKEDLPLCFIFYSMFTIMFAICRIYSVDRNCLPRICCYELTIITRN